MPQGEYGPLEPRQLVHLPKQHEQCRVLTALLIDTLSLPETIARAGET